MTRQWPSFMTKDLDGPDDDAEMQRRWEIYDREMKALIAAGGVHQDEDGWWVDDASGELIGPDPEIERPRTYEELAGARPLADALPELHASIQRARGRPVTGKARQVVSIRLDPEVVEKFKATGPGWHKRINDVLKKAKVG
ncbi:MAG: BrnA antitoxin family protein [Mesorhizobium sp.]|nr:BrnA antitoxin family protein [Mesorhizobium sp.]